jgi:RES domain
MRNGSGNSLIVAAEVPIAPINWSPCVRLIPSRFPTVGLFDAIADPADFEVVFAIEALTNPRLRNELGELDLVPKAERVFGPGSTLIIAAFTHLNPEGSRFSDGSYGVYYASATFDCALAEVIHHRERFLARTNEAAIDIDLRVILADVDACLQDLRGFGERGAAVLDLESYGAAQQLGRALRGSGSMGVVFPSVRSDGGECVGLLRPKALRNARADRYVGLHWDGSRVSHWYEKQAPVGVGR